MLTKGFLNPRQMHRHYTNHGADFGAMSATEYEIFADMFLGGVKILPIQECIRAKGDIVRFNPATDEYGVVDGLSLIHISEPTRLGMMSYAAFCLKKKK